MDKEQVTKLIGKIKETVGENNYKLALAITGHRPGKIRDITMASKDGELLLEYIDNLEQQVKKQKEVIDRLNFIKNRKNQGASQENVNKMAIEFVNSWLKEVSK